MKVTVFDHGAGNLHSLRRALEAAGAEVALEPDPARLLAGDLLVLPGVGAFGHAATRLAPAGRAWPLRSATDIPASAFALACSCCSSRVRRERALASACSAVA